MEIRRKSFGKTLLMSVLALRMMLGAANAQAAAPPAKTITSQTTDNPATAPKPELEPKAIELLKATSARLAAAHTLSFTAVETYESMSRQGHPLIFVNRSEVTLQRPDKLRVITPGDGPASEFYYNGKTITAFAPSENLVAVAAAPATIDAALEMAYHSSGTYFPFTDLIVTDPYKDMAPGLKLAYYVGRSSIVGETTTDIVAYLENGAFIEIWLGVEDKLPRLIHAVYVDDPEQLRHNLLISNWQLDLLYPRMPSRRRALRVPSAFRSPIPTRSPRPTLSSGEQFLRHEVTKEEQVMKKLIDGLLSLTIVFLPCEIAFGYGHANSYGGSTSHSYGSTSHTNASGGSSSHTAGEGSSHTSTYGTSTSHEEGGGTSHTNEYGGTTSGEAGYGAEHTNTYGTTTSASAYHPPTTTTAYAYHPPTAYYGYHPPTTVNYYGSSCGNCSSGSSTAGAAAAGLLVGAAVGASVASANTAAATSNAYAAGVATGSANTAAATTNAYNAGVAAGVGAAQAPMGAIVGAPPAGSMQTVVQGQTYYLSGNTWYQAAYGANGIYYRVVPTP